MTAGSSDSVKTLMLVSCTARKSVISEPIQARDRYLGPTFRAAIEDCARNGLDLAIISAKFGLIRPETLVPPYDTVLKGSVPAKSEWKHVAVISPKDARLRSLSIPPLERKIGDYSEVIVFMPSHYLMILEDVLNRNMHKCRFRVFVRRPWNAVFSKTVIEGGSIIRPGHKYEDVCGRDICCSECGETLAESVNVCLRQGHLCHRDCADSR